MTMSSLLRECARPAAVLALVAGILAAGSCFSERSSGVVTDTSGCVTPPSAAGLPVVFIRKFAYVPATVHVAAGQSVAWVNCEPDGTPHTATADNSSFNSGVLNPDNVYIHGFPAAGTVPYHCDLHPFMKAAVIVD
jgi:plastocyanin